MILLKKLFKRKKKKRPTQESEIASRTRKIKKNFKICFSKHPHIAQDII